MLMISREEHHESDVRFHIKIAFAEHGCALEHTFQFATCSCGEQPCLGLLCECGCWERRLGVKKSTMSRNPWFTHDTYVMYLNIAHSE
jgi:hypothetical protein